VGWLALFLTMVETGVELELDEDELVEEELVMGKI
jgi:hypothetical protein